MRSRVKGSSRRPNKLKQWLKGIGTVMFIFVLQQVFVRWVRPKSVTETQATQMASDTIPRVSQSIKADSAKNSNFQQQSGNGNIQVGPNNKAPINSPSKKVTINNSKTVDSSKTTIVNGFLNQGGTGNTYNQQFNAGSPQRHLDGSFRKIVDSGLRSVANKGYYEVSTFADPECIALGREMENYLDSLGYKEQVKGYLSTLMGSGYNGRVQLWTDTTQHILHAWIGPQE